jgi:hypothetical protein
MTTGATGQLGLALPVQGELSGTWGNTVNNAITEYTNIAIAATLTLTNDGAVTLANTTGTDLATNITSSLTGAGTVTAQFAIVRVTGTLTTAKVVTAPSYSKTYTVVNAATGGIVTFKASGQTGVSIAVGESAFVYYNGTDYVKVSSTVATGVTSFTAGTTGFTPSTATTGAVTLAGTLATTNGGTGLTSFTSGGVVYASSSSVLATGSALVFNGTNLGVGVTPNTWTLGKSISVGDVGSAIFGFGGYNGLVSGAYYDGGWKHSSSSSSQKPALFTATNGSFAWETTGAGTAGNAISFTQAMTLDNSGNLGVGATSIPAGFRLYASGGSMLLDNNTAFRQKDSAGNNTLIFTLSSGNNFELGSGNHTGGMAIVTGNSNITFTTNSAERARIDSVGNVLVGGTAVRGTTVGTKHLDLFDGTAPAGTLTNGVSLYSSSGDLRFMDAAGNAYSVGYRNIPQSGSSKTTSYTLVVGDVGEYILLGASGAIVIPDATFAAGDVVSIFNNTASTATITCSITTAYIAGTFTDKATMTLAAAGVATVLFITSTLCVVNGNVS